MVCNEVLCSTELRPTGGDVRDAACTTDVNNELQSRLNSQGDKSRSQNNIIMTGSDKCMMHQAQVAVDAGLYAWVLALYLQKLLDDELSQYATLNELFEVEAQLHQDTDRKETKDGTRCSQRNSCLGEQEV